MSLPTLVLTAGLGTRLDPLTRLIAKPAVPLGDRTLIEHVLAWLRRQGARDVVLNLHHRPASITSIVGDGAHLGLSVRYSWEQPLLGSAGGPRHALPLLDSDVLAIVNGDTLCDIDLAGMRDAHTRSGADVTLAVVPNPAPDHYNGITIDSHDVVTGFVPRGAAHGSWHFVGVQIAAARVFEDLVDGVAAETVAGIYKDLLVSRPGAIRVWRTNEAFLDVGTPSDYLNAALEYAERARPGSTSPNSPAARLLRSIVWPGAVIEDGVALQDCLVIGRVRVPAGFQARSSVLTPADLVRPGDEVEIRDGVAVFRMNPGTRNPELRTSSPDRTALH
jgi:NDP-sugar pyrophosphorylase family protein